MRSPEELEAAQKADSKPPTGDDEELIGVDYATGQVVGKYRSRKEAADAAARRREVEK